MNVNTITMLLVLFSICSAIYVYHFRGAVKFASAVEYLRKGWPIFAPLNVMLYMATKKWASTPFIKTSHFDHLTMLEDNWQVIAKEAKALLDNGYFEQTTNKQNDSFYDVGFRTFYKYGWSKFYCTWYGTTLNSALAHCPNTVALINKIPAINGAMFTVLPPRSKLTRHLDPAACSLRYHLALDTPNSDQCFINVDGKSQSWRNGEAFMFDETYLHYVENNTDETRLILMCDVERPMNIFGKLINFFYKKLITQMLVPNIEGDQAGIVNKLFAKVTPFLASAKQLKKKKPRVYYPIKWLFNTMLLLLLLSLIISVITMLLALF
ncbi:aspartyl/asparaginyl beta-hydroxylase domain-containing protein [Colwellia sp. 75C3]|uniref:aspartyl/asparaginyl beta-hydroxylase domain-containing protein n=1 Tax=Colwellia sp. 75C3 TaxID=888425 RepID=UPI000C32B01F|nr:aspartyl/asparaginyl beta-hydroxylase domain-containing protein [Colwellia sp. 75C3]PKG83168.1 aspartyl/asparaginyl beta-hydroxylase domain-containing protein [Colwellia sp. 75C3]